MKQLLPLMLSVALAASACNRPTRYDLIVENAAVFDTKDGSVAMGKTILIKADTIVGVISSTEPVRTKRVVDADGRLVTPGNIDTHISFEKAIHSTRKNADNHPKVLTNFYRSKCSRNFLPFGITTAVDMVGDTGWARQMLQWQAAPKFADLLLTYTLSATGLPEKGVDALLGDLSLWGISRIYIANDANIALTGRIVELAAQRGVDVFLKPVNTVSTARSGNALNIEYLYSPVIGIFERNCDKKSLMAQVHNVYGSVAVPEEIYALEAFKYIVENNPALIDTLAQWLGRESVSVSTMLGTMARHTDMGHAELSPEHRLNLTKELRHRVTYSFNHLLSFVRRIHSLGATLRIGTNSENGGLTYISEQLLLAEAGISASDIIRISTLNAARVLGLDSLYGSIEAGKKADLIIYDQSPLDDHRNFASTRRVIKGGKLFKRSPARIELEE